MRANDHGHNHDGNAQKHAYDAPDRPPKGEPEKDREGAHVQGASHQHGFQHAADHELYGGKAEHQNDEGAGRLELYESQQRRKRDRDNGANVGDEVQNEDQKSPRLSEVNPNPTQDRVTQYRGSDADDGLDPKIALNALGNCAE